MSEPIPFFLSRSERNRPLEREFDKFNEKFFSSKLPRYQILVSDRVRNWAGTYAGYCLKNRKMIILYRSPNAQCMIQTLLHEMVHAALPGKAYHGKVFIEELKRVRKIGAPLSDVELDLKEGLVVKLTMRALKSAIEEYAGGYLAMHKNPAKTYLPKFLEGRFFKSMPTIRKMADVDLLLEGITREMKTWAQFSGS